ncbi:MAG: hypothetical protein QM820_05235 [Minicystis sp.]
MATRDTAPGSCARFCRSFFHSEETRLYSLASKRGRATTSLKISNAGLKFFFRTTSETVLPSMPAPVLSEAPRSSTAVESCTASRDPAPSSSMSAVMYARPSLPFGSEADPYGSASVTLTIGSVWRSRSHTFIPFAAL